MPPILAVESHTGSNLPLWLNAIWHRIFAGRRALAFAEYSDLNGCRAMGSIPVAHLTFTWGHLGATSEGRRGQVIAAARAKQELVSWRNVPPVSPHQQEQGSPWSSISSLFICAPAKLTSTPTESSWTSPVSHLKCASNLNSSPIDFYLDWNLNCLYSACGERKGMASLAVRVEIVLITKEGDKWRGK